MLNRVTDSRGYTAYIDDETGDSIREHQLCALASGHDPEEVFSCEVHHLVGVPREFGVKIDLPTAVSPVTCSTHQKIHDEQPPFVPIEEVVQG